MNNYIQKGVTLSLVAPYAVASGAGLLVGAIFGIAVRAADSGKPVEADTQGVYTLPKVSAQAWTVGQKVYWNDTDKVCTTEATDNTLIGVAVEVAANPSATGTVRLNGSF